MRTDAIRALAQALRAVWGLPGLLLCFAAASTHAQAQDAGSDIKTKMNIKVHLTLGAATLPQITQALSAQSGLNIEAADYLRERRLVVQIDSLTLRNALDALTELNDWAWSDKGGGHIVISRLTPLIRQEPSTVPLLMRSALPRDVRVACNLEPLAVQSRKQPASEDAPVDFQAQFHAEHRAADLAQEARLHVIDSLKPAVFNGAPIPFARMKAGEQEDVLVSLLFPAMEATNHDMLRGQTLPWLDNTAGMNLSLNGTTLLVLTHGAGGQYMGFGIQVTP